MSEVRVRFAPSPTGALHIGGVRTALYNYLYAKKHGGKFILRIEDTDQTRFVEGAQEYIEQSLAWLGIHADESISNPGEYGPYKQSERKDLYKKYAQQLLDDGKAYYAFDTSEELTAMREALEKGGATNTTYNAVSRMTMKNSMTLTPEDVQQRLDSGAPYVIRLKVPHKEDIRINDMVRGWVVVHSSAVDDKVLMKSDGMPTYHLANVVDDHLMKISHVIRGEEWLPSAPLHVLLYRFLGWEDTMPQFAHLSLLLKPDGNGKLSKRSADKMGFPIFPLDWKDPETGDLSKGYKEQGYLQGAMINFLAFLGWNPGTEQEIFSMKELCEAFSVERINKAGAKFDIEKAKWFNQQYIKNIGVNDLASSLLADLKTRGVSCTQENAEVIAELMAERISFVSDIYENASFFFETPSTYDEKVVRKKWSPEASELFPLLAQELESLNPFVTDTIHHCISNFFETRDIKMGKFMQVLRVAITGQGGGPDLMLSLIHI